MRHSPARPFLPRQTWMDEGACYIEGIPTAVFFVVNPSDQAVAFAVCERCVVRDECLEYALATFAPSRDHGIWGGTSERERKRIRVQRREAALAS